MNITINNKQKNNCDIQFRLDGFNVTYYYRINKSLIAFIIKKRKGEMENGNNCMSTM